MLSNVIYKIVRRLEFNTPPDIVSGEEFLELIIDWIGGISSAIRTYLTYYIPLLRGLHAGVILYAKIFLAILGFDFSVLFRIFLDAAIGAIIVCTRMTLLEFCGRYTAGWTGQRTLLFTVVDLFTIPALFTIITDILSALKFL